MNADTGGYGETPGGKPGGEVCPNPEGWWGKGGGKGGEPCTELTNGGGGIGALLKGGFGGSGGSMRFTYEFNIR
jgi:hypothetical protein